MPSFVGPTLISMFPPQLTVTATYSWDLNDNLLTGELDKAEPRYLDILEFVPFFKVI